MGGLAQLKKERLVFGVYLIALIIVIELILHQFHLPAWPIFLVMIFFFEAHMDKGRAPHLILGALVGISCYVLTVQFVELVGPLIGVPTARLVFICLAVYSIVAFGEVLPMVFNNYAFMFFLVSGLAAQVSGGNPTPVLWMVMAVIGGVAVIGGILGIRTIMGRFHQPQ